MTVGKRSRLLLLFLFAAFSVSLLQGMLDPDLFWHIRAGRDILEKGIIALEDGWNYLYGGKVWVNQQWLVEIVLAFLFNTGGFTAVFIFKGLVAAGAAYFIFKSAEGEMPSLSLLAAAVVTGLIARYFLMRTQLVSFLLLAALVFLLEKFRPSPRLVPLLALFALWANIHAFFGLGLMVLGMHSGASILAELIKEKRSAVLFTKENLISVTTVPLCALATLVNPFGIKIWQTAGSLFSQRQETLVSEWLPIWKYPLASNMIFFIYFGVLVFLGILFWEKIRFRHLAIALPMIAFGFYSVRILPFATVATAPLFASLLVSLAEALRLGEEKVRPAYPFAALLLLTVSATSISYRATHPVSIPDRVYREDYPVGAMAYLKENGLKGKIWNEFDWGGFIVFSSKDFKTVIDGRTAVLLFPAGILEEWRDTVDVKAGWKERLEKGSPDFVLLFQDDFLSMELARSEDWQILYADEISVLFGRKGSGSGP